MAAREDTRKAVGELLLVETLEAYVAALDQHPELGSDDAVEQLREMSEAPGYGPSFARAAILVEGARGGDTKAAWSEYREALDAAQQLADTLAPLDAEIAVARNARDYARVLELVDRALPIALEIGFGTAVCEMLNQRGLALYNLGTDNRADEIEGAIEAFVAALEVSVAGDQAASMLMHLGLAFGDRLRGDRADNVEHAISALRDALAQLEGSDNDELRAMVLTNLSAALGRGERGDRVEVLREAAARCREALTVRSLDRNADDWAYSQLNLGEALRDLAALGEADVDEARAAFEAVVHDASAIRDSTLVGAAHQMLGGMDVATTERGPQDYVDDHAAGTLEELDEEPALHAARAHFEAARDLIATDPIRRARVLHQLSGTLAALNEVDDAIEAAQEALTVLRPTTAPSDCKDAAWSLGWLLTQREDWEGAAEALRDAVEAAELAFHARLDAGSREREARSSGNLYRWAAYAMARADDVKTAAVVLDTGRAREIGRRLGGDQALVGVPAELREAYQAAVEALATSPIGSDDSGASRHLQEVVTAIREIPGHERFGRGPQWKDLAKVVGCGWPLIYVNPTPAGTLLLALWPDGTEGATAEATFIAASSMDVFMRLVAGDGAEDLDAEDVAGASYLFGMASETGQEQFPAALDQLLPWLGSAVSRHIAEVLASRNATRATLVLCGPIGLTPLHAACWESDGAPRCLADSISIRFAPSAVISAAAQRRATRSRTLSLVALADPNGDLPAARPEIEEIAALFDRSKAKVAIGPSANVSFLRRYASRATHVHFACHAHGGLFDSKDAAISLASGDVPAVELTTVAALDARLVVVSACESALSAVAGVPDEVVSIATALIASGSACAIASLWPVDDLATAILMVRLYEEMLANGEHPTEALRHAQLWLRDLTEDEEEHFLGRHAGLANEFDRRAQSARGTPGTRATRGPAGTSSDRGVGTARPYRHPIYWAPFIAVGA